MSDSEEDYYPSADEDEPKWYDDYGTALAVKPVANYGKMKVEKSGFMKMSKKCNKARRIRGRFLILLR